MQVLSWKQKRQRLLRQLATLDEGIARRADDLVAAWDEYGPGTVQDAAQVEPVAVASAPMAPNSAPPTVLKPSLPPTLPPQLRVPVSTSPEPESQAKEVEPPPVAPARQKSLASYLE